VVTKQSTWTPASNLFDWTIVIRDSGAVTYRNRVTGSTSEHVPITLHRIITEDLRKVELPPAGGPTPAQFANVVAPVRPPLGADSAIGPAVHVRMQVFEDDDEPPHGTDEEEGEEDGGAGGGPVVVPSRVGDWESFLDEDSGAYYWCVRACVRVVAGVRAG
jgi:hypothetical protein